MNETNCVKRLVEADRGSHDLPQAIHDDEWNLYLSKRRRKVRDGIGQETGADAAKTTSDWRNRLTGIAISGGGIRSAAFSLGVLQRLAKANLLRFFDYLSTVSGGGYSGSSVSYLINHPEVTRDEDRPDLGAKFPYGDPVTSWKDPSPTLEYVRSHGNYLTPGGGIGAVSLFGITLQAILLNLGIWLPVLLLVTAALQRLVVWDATTSGIPVILPWARFEYVWPVLLLFAVTLLIGLWIRSLEFEPRKAISRGIQRLRWFTWLGCSLASLVFLLIVIVYGPRPGTDSMVETGAVSTASDVPSEADSVPEIEGLSGAFEAIRGELPKIFLNEVPLIFKAFHVIALFAAIAFAGAIVVYSLVTTWQTDSKGYRWRRRLARAYRVLLHLFAIFALLSLVPYLSKAADIGGGITALIGGIAIGFWKLYQRGKAWISLDAIAPVAAVLIFFGLFVTAYSIGSKLDFTSSDALSSVAFWFLAGTGLAAAVLGYVVNLNHISIGRYYRDRLMETFMPNMSMINDNRNDRSHCASKADNFRLHTLAHDCRTPYHLVNTHAVLIDSDDETCRKRGGDAFVFSPLYVGSTATGWLCAGHYWHGEMTLATAMATSAAAINPHTGVSGRGVTTNRAVSLLMALLNVRLGYWAPNPRRPSASTRMHHFWSGWYELSPRAGYKETSSFVQLSDGGHFDNLGLYELFRRRVRFILVLDGGADADFQFEDLQNALYRAEQDFKVRISFQQQDGIAQGEVKPFDDLIPQEQDPVSEKFPEGLKLAECGYAKGRIYYDEETPSGWLFLVKTTLIKRMSMRVKGYKGAHPDFPDQSTVDQFFDEDQFDAYRILGDEIATELLSDTAFDTELRRAYLGATGGHEGG